MLWQNHQALWFLAQSHHISVEFVHHSRERQAPQPETGS
ncbi:Uncharacterised protein [Vibrio cholerae]|nr:Uncharacterised protein [Vibrio cholerae]